MYLEVRRGSANQASKTDNCVEPLSLRGPLGRHRNLVGPWHADDGDVALDDSGVTQRVLRSAQQPFSHEIVEP